MEQAKLHPHPKELFKRYGASDDGEIYNLNTGKRLQSIKMKNGYYSVTISNNKGFSKLLSRFVYECHKGLIPPKLICDHIDGDIANNKISNLQILTQSENLKRRRPMKKRAFVKVEATNMNDKTKKVYDSMSKASKELQIYTQRIKDVCDGITKTTTSRKDNNKYTFTYLNQ